ncbi:hypothetical protein H6501_03675 [Candidatus Woesearchaeota archaeon]|nr:hypothetical protein [Nanoarchaeota archaeon]MCB9370670.1 hypothetical protein [Candidatus Woesearchaeota archaeon]USN43754.1 MAG: hypothetical protein H6500_05175 [Candidatus Woesearchaeota archaeon]
MEKKAVLEKIKSIRKNSKERKFAQTFDLIVNLQNLDLRKPEHKIDVGVALASSVKAKPLKILAIVDQGIPEASKVFDKVLYNDELVALKGNMKKIRQISQEFDKFVVQLNYMPVFAQIMGRYLGPLNKMPSPKLGMVINPKTPIKELYEKLQKTAHLQTKKNLVIQVSIGSEKESDDVIAENVVHVYEVLLHALPNHKNNVKNVGLKLTMGKLEVL